MTGRRAERALVRQSDRRGEQPGRHRRRAISSAPRRSGRAIGSPSVTANVVAAVDAVERVPGATTTDGCSPFTNAGAVAGKIALVERGTAASR